MDSPQPSLVGRENFYFAALANVFISQSVWTPSLGDFFAALANVFISQSIWIPSLGGRIFILLLWPMSLSAKAFGLPRWAIFFAALANVFIRQSVF